MYKVCYSKNGQLREARMSEERTERFMVICNRLGIAAFATRPSPA